MSKAPNLMERLRTWWLRTTCPTEFLCDNCRYDYDAACRRPQRPNAVKCPDYKPK
jgi:hypothetical protein